MSVDLREARTRGRAWLAQHRVLVAGVLLALVALAVVAAVGGFREQSRDGLRLTQSELVESGRFTVRVERVELSNTPAYSDVPGDPGKPPVFRVWAAVTNTSDTSVAVASFRLLDFVVPGGGDPDETSAAQTVEWDVQNLDPDVPTEVYIERTWPAGTPGAPVPAGLTVHVLQEVERTGFLVNADDPPVPGPALGSMTVPVKDHRVAAGQR